MSRSPSDHSGYVKFNVFGLAPGGTANCLETRPPTLAPTSPPSPSPTPAPTTASPTRPPTATPSMFPTFTGAVRRVDEGALDDNSEDDKTSGGTIAIIVVVVLVLLIAAGVMAFYGMAYWKKADVERKVVHSSSFVCSNSPRPGTPPRSIHDWLHPRDFSHVPGAAGPVAPSTYK